MKATFFYVVFLLTITVNSQDFDRLFVGIGQDIRMSYEGPHVGKVNDTNGGKLDLELKAGLEGEKWRLWGAYEWFEAIKYHKWTYIGIDYKINWHSFSFMAGVELSEIKRINPDAHYTDPINYIKIDVTNFLPGVNFETKWNIKNWPVAIGAHASVFKSERILRIYGKKYRTEVMLNIYYNFEL